MERSRFSFRRKNSQTTNRDKDSRNIFDAGKMTYVRTHRMIFSPEGFITKREWSYWEMDCMYRVHNDSTDTARQLYGELLDEYKLSLDQLLEVTGFLCATVISKVYPKSTLHKSKGSILVCCGPGRNGAEGLGYRPTVFYPKPANDGVNQALTDQCERHGLPFLYYLPSEVQLITDSYNLVVDAVYGFNFEGPASNEFSHIIHTLARTKLPIISINLPSGWNDDDCPSSESDETFLQPETLLSLMVPLTCSRSFRGKNHYLLGHLLLPQDLTSKYDLVLPGHRDSDHSCFDMLSVVHHGRTGSPANHGGEP